MATVIHKVVCSAERRTMATVSGAFLRLPSFLVGSRKNGYGMVTKVELTSRTTHSGPPLLELAWDSSHLSFSGQRQKRRIIRGLRSSSSGWTTPLRNSLDTYAVVEEETELKPALEKLKELVDLQGGNSKDADDGELLRFLRAKSLDIENAATAFVSHQKWREEFVPKGYFLEEDLPEELEAKKMYWISKDRKGRPAMIVTGRDHVYNKEDFDQFKRLVVYAFDRLIREAPEERFMAVVDLKGLGLKNLDATSFLAALNIVENHYPQRLDKVFLINVPLIFNGVWKVVTKFLSEGSRKRFIFVDKKKTVESLSNEIDIEFLPKEYGGNADFILLQDAATPNWPPSS